MSFTLNNLSEFIQEGGLPYVQKAIDSAPTVAMLKEAGAIQYGIKGSAEVLGIGSDVQLVANGSCSARVPSGSSILSGRKIELVRMAWFNDWCADELWNSYFNKALNVGQSPEESFKAEFVNMMMTEHALNVAKTVEVMTWAGDKTLTGTTNNKYIDGIVKQVSATTSSATGSTMVEKLQNFYLANNSSTRSADDFVIAVSKTVYDEYKIALAAKNIYQPTEDMTLFGTTAKLHVVPADALGRTVVGIRKSNIRAGADGQGDFDNASIKYDAINDKWFFDFKFAYAVVIVYNDSTQAIKATV